MSAMVKLSLEVLLETMEVRVNFREFIEKLQRLGSRVKREDPINLSFLVLC